MTENIKAFDGDSTPEAPRDHVFTTAFPAGYLHGYEAGIRAATVILEQDPKKIPPLRFLRFVDERVEAVLLPESEGFAILRDLAANEPIGTDTEEGSWCVLCGADQNQEQDDHGKWHHVTAHLPTCPWLRAKKLVEGK